MKVVIYASMMKDTDFSVSHDVAAQLGEWGAEVWVDEQHAEHYRDLPVFTAPPAECCQNAQFVVSVGGDGTFIKASHMSAPQGVPVLGINRGTTGFLTELEVGELQQLRRLFTGEYTLEHRMMLEFTILRDGKRYHRGLALNDVTVQRGIVPRLLTTDVHNGALMITRFRGDGVIVATPTGSTGYALSAGGPVIDPRTNCIEVAPICAHSLANRSIVFGSNAKLTILPRLEEGRSAHLFNDGASSVLVHHGDTIAVQRARQKTTVVRMKPDSFYSTMRIKLREF